MQYSASVALAFLVGFASIVVSDALGMIERTQQQQQQPHPLCRQSRRETLVGSLSTIIFGTPLVFIPLRPQKVEAVSNPLNLKGTYWETGELYVKKKRELPDDPDDLLPSLSAVASALESLQDLVVEGKWDELLRKLRGGVISESQIRLTGYALLDLLPTADDDDDNDDDDDDVNNKENNTNNESNEDSKNRRRRRQLQQLVYLCRERFQLFLIKLSQLDTIVESTGRQSKVDGGFIETIGLAIISPFRAANQVAQIINTNTNTNANEPDDMSSDPRVNVLTALEDTIKAARSFTQTVEEALRKKSPT